MNTFAHARNEMKMAFETDPGLKLAYLANIAMLLHDKHGITDMEARNKAAEDIMRLIFWYGEDAE